jgi:hypothetical protein
MLLGPLKNLRIIAYPLQKQALCRRSPVQTEPTPKPVQQDSCDPSECGVAVLALPRSAELCEGREKEIVPKP